MTGKDEDRGVTSALKISQFVGVYDHFGKSMTTFYTVK